MSYKELSYTKDWRNAEDFPTVEADERKVRADMQFLFDEIKNYINEVLVAALNSTEGAANTLTRSGAPVQVELDRLEQELRDLSQGLTDFKSAAEVEHSYLRGEISYLRSEINRIANSGTGG